ncbi:MAG: UDP-N-acetylglucosamine 2-epimerase (non-hydrolyzing) [Elusimicrobia bacterium]|nr:UDP-N-acetylglucosamine 2-epimerase (non-hydrolyzing) [Elusimicrobiota bacterium]
MNILVVMGTRPEAIKLAPVVWALRRRKRLRTFVCATGQHREILDQMLRTFQLKPDYDLAVMRRGQSLDEVTRRVLSALPPVMARVKPGLVVVQGDTTTALAAALCATHHRVPVAHIEAGLRSFDPAHPFPEERNRVLIDHLATLHFPPTSAAKANLAREGIRGAGVVLTGNTVVDALTWALARSRPIPRAARGQREVLVTLHRRESFGKPLESIFRALMTLVRRHPDLVLTYPVHPNPRVVLSAKRLLRHPRIRLIKPQPYLDFVRLMGQAEFLITDSGGLQEESISLRKPVLIVRKTTERSEVVTAGAGRLVGLNPKKLIDWASRLLKSQALYRRMRRAPNPFGDGKAAERIASAIAGFKP